MTRSFRIEIAGCAVTIDYSDVWATLVGYSTGECFEALKAFDALARTVHSMVAHVDAGTSWLHSMRVGRFTIMFDAAANSLTILLITTEKAPLPRGNGAFLVRRNGTVRLLRVVGNQPHGESSNRNLDVLPVAEAPHKPDATATAIEECLGGLPPPQAIVGSLSAMDIRASIVTDQGSGGTITLRIASVPAAAVDYQMKFAGLAGNSTTQSNFVCSVNHIV